MAGTRAPRRAAAWLMLLMPALAARAAPAAPPRPSPQRHNALEAIAAASAPRAAPEPSITLTASASRLRRGRGQWVTVSWRGAPGPDAGDWIGVLPADGGAGAPLGSDVPFKYAMASRSPTHLATGAGSLREMAVTWSTRNASRPVVRWGARKGRLDRTAPAGSRTYTRDEVCGPPANGVGWSDPGLVHTAVLTGLEPGATYYYRFGDEALGFSPEFSFRAAPAPGPRSRVRFLAIADLGQAEVDGSLEENFYVQSLNTTRWLAKEAESHQLLLHNGDISYARGYVSQWDNWHAAMERVAARIPHMTAPGNHEVNWPGTGDRFDGSGFAVYDSGGECGVAYETRLAMPAAGPGRPWYAFTFGPVRFIQYSSEHSITPGSEQHEWLTRELEGVDRSFTPWLVVSGHRPLYISSTNNWWPDGDQPVAREGRRALEGLLFEHGADLTLHGHHHSYQRTCPVYAGRCLGFGPDGAAKGPVHLVIGNAGATLSTNVPFTPDPIWETIKFYWGYLRVSATATELAVEAASNLDALPRDAFALRKPDGWGARWPEERRRRREWLVQQQGGQGQGQQQQGQQGQQQQGQQQQEKQQQEKQQQWRWWPLQRPQAPVAA
ncbi:inactive purple acid phosphatase-like [Raphidocelis subcapitata]|uniref:Purple acid phosphatase n=1 Tax=Raphidocelis subcapitata TaxID=307507 RepID=A0A2V0P5W8_9CHLO|nr:inactive purple acid phosphatase-like [Raphidocelis subcapitata]|eukprot:GBF94969.1 inactive purple acid phosphatase-like [Raphidocelis subcapitata]